MRSTVAVVLLILACLVAPVQAKFVACVGDSITYGSGISDRANDSYPAQLERLLKQYDSRWEVGNFGVSGATLLRNGDRLRFYGRQCSLVLGSSLCVIADQAVDLAYVCLGIALALQA